MTNQPSGTVTFLFTDIEGSTRIAQAHPDRWDALCERHHAILRAAIKAARGYLFQDVGDALCAAFPSARDALAAALQSQSDLQREAWGDVPITVRMAIHTGMAEVQPDGDYRGFLILSRTQRIMSAAHGGQVLISQTTAILLGNELPPDATLRDLGERRLRDLIQPEHVYQLVIPGLRADFPPIKTLESYRHNLPALTTSFVGREKETAELKRAIKKHRLVTLTGSGGTGKTRLSLQVAADLLDQFQDGVWFIELAPLANPDLIAQTILSVFGIGEMGGRAAAETLLDHIRDKQLLLLLDNCEHLVEPCAALVDGLLTRSPALKILASSREALGVKGEMVWHTPSLALPPDSRGLTGVGNLLEYEAVRLFIERAALIQPHFQVTQTNLPLIAQICRRLDGIPLALELAAARLKALSVEQIAARLDDRFRLLTGGARTALPRQQTLRALIDWSYNLLSEKEKTLFRRLAVFVGGWTLEAAEAICPGGIVDSGEVLELLANLVDKSLVVAEEVGQQMRYRRLETIRQYAREMFLMSGEVTELRGRHLAHYLSFAESAAVELKGRGQVVWMAALEAEHDNLRAALEWSFEVEPESGLRIGVALLEFWDAHGHLSEARQWMDRLLSASNILSPTRVDALYGAASLGLRQSDMESLRRLDEGLALAQTLRYRRGIANGLMFRGVIKALLDNDIGQAEALHGEALAIFRELGDQLAIGQALGPVASCALSRYDYGRAEGLFNESLALFRAVGNEREIAGALWNLSEVALLRRNYASAQALAEESLARYRALGDRHGVATALRALSLALHNLGEAAKAQTAAEQSAEDFRAISDRECLGITLTVLARVVADQQDRWPRAGELIREGCQYLREMGDKYSEAIALDVMGRIACAQGDFPAAQGHFRAGLTVQRDSHDERAVPTLLEALVLALASASPVERAVRLLGAAEALRGRIGLARMEVERAGYERAVFTLRGRVDGPAFAALWVDGQGLSTAQAIELALNHT